MSFQDFGKRSRAVDHRTPKRPSPVKRPPSTEHQPSPTLTLDVIDDAIKAHELERNSAKERSFIESSTTVSRYEHTKRSAFSKLNDEIVHFQKMVTDIQRYVDAEVTTPEDQWRIRILMKSASDADLDLSTSIEKSPWNKRDLTVKSSFSKLKRDYERIHKNLALTMQAYHKTQQVEMSLLSSTNNETTFSVHHGRPQSLATIQEEDFFDREMREREEETKKINSKLHVVDDIYEELGRLVSDQQERIDLIEDRIRYARAASELGLEHLERSRDLMCGIHNSAREPPPSLVSEEDLSWSLPFQTLRYDLAEVRNDLLDMVYLSTNRIKRISETPVFQCGPDTASDGFTITS